MSSFLFFPSKLVDLKLQHCRGQCYDGANSMLLSDVRNIVARILTDSEPRAVYTQCYGLRLNLAIGDTIKNCKVMKSCLEVVYEITKLIKKSPIESETRFFKS